MNKTADAQIYSSYIDKSDFSLLMFKDVVQAGYLLQRSPTFLHHEPFPARQLSQTSGEY